VGKITVIFVTFLRDVPCQKLFRSANVSLSYSKNNTGTVFLRHDVVTGSPSRSAVSLQGYSLMLLCFLTLHVIL